MNWTDEDEKRLNWLAKEGHDEGLSTACAYCTEHHVLREKKAAYERAFSTKLAAANEAYISGVTNIEAGSLKKTKATMAKTIAGFSLDAPVYVEAGGEEFKLASVPDHPFNLPLFGGRYFTDARNRVWGVFEDGSANAPRNDYEREDFFAYNKTTVTKTRGWWNVVDTTRADVSVYGVTTRVSGPTYQSLCERRVKDPGLKMFKASWETPGTTELAGYFDESKPVYARFSGQEVMLKKWAKAPIESEGRRYFTGAESLVMLERGESIYARCEGQVLPLYQKVDAAPGKYTAYWLRGTAGTVPYNLDDPEDKERYERLTRDARKNTGPDRAVFTYVENQTEDRRVYSSAYKG